MVSAGFFGTGALDCIHVLNFIAYLEIAQEFHRNPAKNQLIADKIRIHILLYLIALYGNSTVSIQGVY